MSFVHKQLGHDGGFGESLKELRELRGLSLESLSKLTKIHPSVIQILEEERLVDLADPIYAERHVRVLAIALEGRPGYFLQKYRDLLQTEGRASPNATRVRETVRRRDFFVTSRLVAAAGFLVFAAAAAAYLVWQAYLLQEPPPLTIISPLEAAQLDTPHVEVKGETAANASVTVNGQKAVVGRDGIFRLTFDIPRGLTVLVIEAKRRYGSPVVILRRVTYERQDGRSATSTKVYKNTN